MKDESKELSPRSAITLMAVLGSGRLVLEPAEAAKEKVGP